jgi:drug/metabolite transporter (DMT)-like permease
VDDDQRAAAGPAPPSPAAATAADLRLADPRVRTALLVLGVVAVSSAAILARVAVAPALALAWWRTAVGALALVPGAVRARVRPTPRERVLLVTSGLLLGAHFWWWFASLELTTVAASAVLVSLSPVPVGIGSAWLLGEPPGRRTWAGLALTVIGAVTIVLGDLGGATPRALLGDGLALAAALAMAGYLLVGRRARRTLPVSVYATWTYGSAAAVLGAVALATGTPLGLRGGFDMTTWLAIAGLIVGPQLLGHTVFNLVLGRVSATVVAVVIIAEPVGATILASLLLDEAPGALFWLGAPLVLGGVVLASRPPPTRLTGGRAPR